MRVALLCNDDLTTNLIFAPLFDMPGVEVTGVYFASSPHHRHKNFVSGVVALLKRMSARYWLYLVATNGCYKLFDLTTRMLRLSPRSGPLASLRRLAAIHGIPCTVISDFSSATYLETIRSMKADLLLIRVSVILKPELLALPSIGTWCVHSSLLPAFKGIAGEFHALRTADAPIGSTVFLVTPKLDQGPPIAQIVIARDETRSVYDHMIRNNQAGGALLGTMLQDRMRGESPVYPLPGNTLEPSYFSWPSAENVAEARAKGMKLITIGEWLRLLCHAVRFCRHSA